MDEDKALVKREEKEERVAKREPEAQQGSFDLQTMIESFGSIELTEEQKEILFAPPKEEEIQIRPDGLIYVPWISYAKRLRAAFGMQWGLVPAADAKILGELVARPFFMVIKGKPVGAAVGECRYSARNQTMTYGDAIEGARSNALSRLGKGIGMFLELWDHDFGEAWKKRNAKIVLQNGKQIWIKVSPIPSEEAKKEEEKK